MSIEKISGIAEASIEKLIGISNSSVQKVNGIDMDAPIYPVSYYKARSSGLTQTVNVADRDGAHFIRGGIELAQGASATLASFSLTCESGVPVSVISGETWDIKQRTAAGGIPAEADRNAWTLSCTVAGTEVRTQTSSSYSYGEYYTDNTIFNTQASSVTVAQTVSVDSSGHADTVFQVGNYVLRAASFKEGTGGPALVAQNIQIDTDSASTSWTPLQDGIGTSYIDIAGDGSAVSVVNTAWDAASDNYLRRLKDDQRILVVGYFMAHRTDGSGGTRTFSLNVGGTGAITASSSAAPYEAQIQFSGLEDSAGESSVYGDVAATVTCSSGGGAFKGSFANFNWQVTSGTGSA